MIENSIMGEGSNLYLSFGTKPRSGFEEWASSHSIDVLNIYVIQTEALRLRTTCFLEGFCEM
jgi:hypothetical protein